MGAYHDDMELMAKFAALMNSASYDNVIEETETGFHFEGEYKASNGDILTYAHYEMNADPEAMTATIYQEVKAIIDGASHTYSVNASGSVDASGNPTVVNYELKIDGTPIKINLDDIPSLA